MTTALTPAAAFRAHAAKVRNVPLDEILGDPIDPATAHAVPHTTGRAWAYTARLTSNPEVEVRGWVTADATVITAEQNLGILMTEAGVWDKPLKRSVDELANKLAGDLVWSYGMNNGVVDRIENGMAPPALTLGADGSGTLRLFSNYRRPGPGGAGGGPVSYFEITVVLTADHKATLTRRPWTGADTVVEPMAAFRAYAAQLLGVPLSEVEGGAADAETAAKTPHSVGGVWACTMWRKGDPSREVRGWVTDRAAVVAPDQRLAILLSEAGVWHNVSQSRLQAITGQVAEDLVWAFGIDNALVTEAADGMAPPKLTRASDGSGTLRFFSRYRRPGPGGAAGGPVSYSETVITLTADQEATLTQKPFAPTR